MIKFKIIKYKHRLESREISAKITSGEMTDVDDTKFVMRMVEDWDLKDEETGEPIEVGEYRELSLVQHAEVMRAWEQYADEVTEEVKKTRDGSSSSG